TCAWADRETASDSGLGSMMTGDWGSTASEDAHTPRGGIVKMCQFTPPPAHPP
ncbi:Hypothetical protein SMAX5B_000954, partial [Scophthalmus maximus]